MIDANIVTSTAADAEMATPRMIAKFISNRPSSEITTTVPANITARPAVEAATFMACSGSLPRCRPSRKRVTMSKA